MGLFLGSLFCFIDLWVCFSARTLLFWLLYLCSIVQNQGQWLLKFCSSFSILPWLFRVLCASIQILKSFALVFWEMPLLLWKELQWFCKLPWALIRSRSNRTLYATTNWFRIEKGIWQGCLLYPCWFNLYTEHIMRNAGLDEVQSGIKTVRRNINNLRYAIYTTLMAKAKMN